MHTNVILTNKRRIHAQPNYTNTKLKAWFRRLLHHPARKQSGPILQSTPSDPHGWLTAGTNKNCGACPRNTEESGIILRHMIFNYKE